MSSPPTIGIVISCYIRHIQKLFRLLDSIAQQTVLPVQVVVSSSSCEPSDFPALPQYPFPVTLILHRERKNAAQNRNIAMKLVTTDIVSFIDADDIMLPRRLEAVRTAFDQGAKFVVHNYTHDLGARDNGAPFVIEHNMIIRAPSLCIVHKRNYGIPMHQSQSSVAREIIQEVQYREGTEYERREDSVFCGDVVVRGYPNAYITNILTLYDESGAW
jgi:glycosyltransferase involved in cell wall biosynthesis